MPSVERTTSGMIDPSTATIQGTIDGLRIPLAIGSVVSAATINSLLAMWRSFNDHYHQTGDLFGDGYGNTGSYAAGANNWDTNPENTSRMGGTEPVDVVAGDTIYATKHEEIKNAILTSNGHFHTIDDRTA